jgi:hypothetical protein
LSARSLYGLKNISFTHMYEYSYRITYLLCKKPTGSKNIGKIEIQQELVEGEKRREEKRRREGEEGGKGRRERDGNI